MLRRFLVMAIALTIVLVVTAGTTYADDNRLGGAYRGPYEENTKVRAEEEPDSSDQGTSSTGPSSGDTGGEETGGEDTGGGGVDGTGSDSGDGDGSGEGEGQPAAPPPDAGTGGTGGGDNDPGSSGPEAPDSVGGTNPAPSNPGTGPSLTPGRGKVAQQDIQAYWMFWFEHNKEWILSELFQNRMGMDIPTSSSAWYFSGGASEVRRQPISDADRKERVLPVLTDMLGHTDVWVRDAAVMALGKLGGEDVVNVLKVHLGKETKIAVRQDLLLALGLTQQKAALTILINELSSKSNVQHKPYAALGLALLGMPDQSVQMLLKEFKIAQKGRGGSDEAAACLAVALGELGDERIVEELAMPIRNRGDNQLQVYVCLALGKIGGDKARTWLFRALSSRDGEVQQAAVLALSGWDDKAVIGYLKGKPGLKSGKRMSKLFALVSMGRIGKGLDAGDSKRKMIRLDVSKMAESVARDKYTAMYGALAMALMGEEASNKFFIEAMAEGQKYPVENRSAIAMACGLLGIEGVERDLRSLAGKKSEDQDLRGYALMALGIMGDTKSKELVRKIMSDDRPRHQVLRSGAWALGLLGDPSDVGLLLETLKRDGPGYHTARGAAALAIGMCGDGTSLDQVLKLIAEAPKNTTRAFAISALGCLVDRESVPRIPKLFMNVHYRKPYPVVKEVLSIL